jgi:hypothetical protein
VYLLVLEAGSISVCTFVHDIVTPRNWRVARERVHGRVGKLKLFGGSESICCSFVCITEGVVARPRIRSSVSVCNSRL